MTGMTVNDVANCVMELNCPDKTMCIHDIFTTVAISVNRKQNTCVVNSHDN